MTYQRYNIEFEEDWMREELKRDFEPARLVELAEMDVPANMDELEKIGVQAARKQVKAS